MDVNCSAVISFFSTTLLVVCALPAIATQSVRLTWVASSSPDAVGYNVYYGLESGFYTEMLSVTGDTTLNVDDLEDGLTYYFAVTAYDSSGLESGLSNEASYVAPGLAPPVGAPFISQLFPDHSVTLGWNPSPSPDVQGYFVYYGTQSGIYDTSIWVQGDTQVDIYNLVQGVTYYFAVTTVNSSGLESAPSAEMSYTIPVIEPPQDPPTVQQKLPDPTVTVSWNASPSPDVAGYIVYYGTQSGVYDNWLNVGAGDSVDVGGLDENTTYYFAVSAYDDAGEESIYSPESFCFVQPVSTLASGVFLSLQQIPVAGFPNAFLITASAPVSQAWTLEGSSDLKTWGTLATGAEPEINVTVVVSQKPALFFRLGSWFDDIPVELQTGEINRYPHSFAVTTPYAVPWDWSLESSEDLLNWSPFITGYFASVKVAIVNASTPALFFRLKGG